MSAPQVGDVITTAEELDALPVGVILLDRGDRPYPVMLTDWRGWSCANGSSNIRPAEVISDGAPLTVLYLPGTPPRPERVVKAESLREYAAAIRSSSGPDVHEALISTPNLVAAALCDRADEIEATR